jgi:hypothetical protein
MDQFSIPWSSNVVTDKSVPCVRAFEAGLSLRPYPSPLSSGGWFFIEFSSMVDEIDAGWSFGHGAEKASNPDPSKFLKGRPPAKTVKGRPPALAHRESRSVWVRTVPC